MYRGIRKFLSILLPVLGIWIFVRFFLPLFLPFLLGGLLALGAEPMVSFLDRSLHLRRSTSAVLGVTGALCLLSLLLLLAGALILREIGALVRVIPELERTAAGGLSAISSWALNLIGKLPAPIRDILSQSAGEFFSGSSRLVEGAFGFLLNFTGGILRHVPDSALVLGTGILSAYMISIRMPRIRSWISRKLPRERLEKFLFGLSRMKTALIGWLKAQAKLMGITWIILTLGFVVLRVPYAPVWAGAVSLVDAFPILGVGTVLLPWSLVMLIQSDNVRALGLLGIYVVVSLSRSVLEPRLLGSHLGLDPLVTLAAIYAGYHLWGFPGMILAPVLAVAAVQLFQPTESAQD